MAIKSKKSESKIELIIVGILVVALIAVSTLLVRQMSSGGSSNVNETKMIDPITD